MPLVSVKMLTGRTAEEKQKLCQRIVEAFDEVLGVPEEQIWTVIDEVDAEEWFIGSQTIAQRRSK